jgi:hypothetical protein
MISVSPGQELNSRKIAEIMGVTRRTAQYWLAGTVRPSRFAQQRLDTLGIRILPPPSKPSRANGRRRLSPRHVRELIEEVMAEIGWHWCERVALLIEELLIREEREAAGE